MRATFNITTNRFKVWFDDRLSPEDYKRAKDCNFVWYPGQKCFSSIWYPQAEDFIKSFGMEIDQDDTPDDVESRVERFEKYADRSTQAADQASDYAGRDDITPRRAKLAEARAQNETEKAAHWNQRIAGAISNAQHKDRPEVIARRIKGIDADLRRNQRKTKVQGHADGYDLINNHWIKPENVPAHIAHAQRWIDHLTRRLEYENAYLEAIGGTALLTPEKKPRRVAVAPDDGIKKGDTVIYRDGFNHAGQEHRGVVLSTGAHYLKVTKPEDAPEWWPDQIKTLRRFCTKVTA